MERDTPLDEVARFLPRSAAEILMNVEGEGRLVNVQEAVLIGVRDAVCHLEDTGIDLDPMELEAVLTIIVAQTTILHLALDKMTTAFESAVGRMP